MLDERFQVLKRPSVQRTLMKIKNERVRITKTVRSNNSNRYMTIKTHYDSVSFFVTVFVFMTSSC